MNGIRDFIWLFKQSLDLPREAMVVTMALVIIVATTWFYIHIIRRRSFKKTELLTLIPFITMFILLLWGTLFAHQDSQSKAPQWPSYVNLVIFTCHIPICGFIIWKAKGFRLLAVEISLLAGWYAFWALFTAQMSVTGNWI
ncbi:MAG: hypothetical protein KAS96_05060 [Planctomycetes bacterium]|nr:hypothetical protein [Planctomycetota bacterium]